MRDSIILGKEKNKSLYCSFSIAEVFIKTADFGFRELLPNGTRSFLVQPLLQASDQEVYEMGRNEGFIVLVSSMSYAYSDKDRAWIKAVANKFTGKTYV